MKGVDISSLDIDDLDTGRIRAIKLQALEKEKTEMGEKIRITGKRIDHLERAYRKEESKHLSEDYDAQRKEDLAAYEKSKAETERAAETKHKEDVALKHRLSRLVPTYETFKRDITNARHADFEKRRKAAERELNQKIDQRRREVREQKAAEKRRAAEEERQRREEEEQRIREEEEAERAAEEKKRKDAEAKAEAEKRRAERDASARKQMEREQEAEQRRLERKAAAGTAPSRPFERAAGEREKPSFERRAPEEPSASAGGPPKLNLAGNKPSLREREAAKAAGLSSGAPAETRPSRSPAAEPKEEEVAPARKPGGYVPPGLRGKGAGETMPARSDSRDGGDRWQRRAPPAEGERSESPAASGGNAYKPPASRAGGASGGAYKPPGRR